MINDLKKIGFYDCVEIGGRFFHVSTEVIGNEALQIRTTVLEGGTVLDSSSSALAPGDAELQECEDVVQAHHLNILKQVQHGEIC